MVITSFTTIEYGVQEEMTKELTLHPYQIEGAVFLANKMYALLADDCGLGKTATTIHALKLVDAKRVLVVCPAAVRINWGREIEMWSDREYEVIMAKRGWGGVKSSDYVAIISYDFLTVHFDSFVKSAKWDCIVIDEMHFLKNHKAQRTIAAFGKNGIIRNSKRMWCLSATPMPNHVAELWPMLYTFGATQIKYESFVKKYCQWYMETWGIKIAGTNRDKEPEIRAMLKTMMMRRRKEDVRLELPPISFFDTLVLPGKVDLELEPSYSEYFHPTNRENELLEKLDKEEKLVRQLLEENVKLNSESGMKLLEAIAKSVSTLRRYNGMQKVEPIAEILTDELMNGAYHKVVIFAVHQAVIEGLRSKLERFGCVTLYGGTPPNKRQVNIDRFQTNPAIRVFIGNIQAAGTGITLTAADQVVVAESSWVPAENAQAIMRCHRIGQANPVTVRHFALKDSLDQKIQAAIKRKTRDIAVLFDPMILDQIVEDGIEELRQQEIPDEQKLTLPKYTQE